MTAFRRNKFPKDVTWRYRRFSRFPIDVQQEPEMRPEENATDRPDASIMPTQRRLMAPLAATLLILVVGFGGSRWYNGRGNQFKESEMAGVVRKVINKVIRLRRY